VRKESKNGVEAYPVYVHRRSGEVRRPWTGFSGEAKSDSLLGELHRGMPFAGQTPVISGSGEVERARRSTVDVYGGFIGTGAGNGAGSALVRRGARGGARGRALASSERVEHVALCFCSCSTLC
jgi:hypothetical protein